MTSRTDPVDKHDRLSQSEKQMTKAELMKRLEGLNEDQFSKIAPYLKADLDAAEELPAILSEIEAGRNSRDTEQLLTTQEALSQARKRLSK